jgi:ribosome-binding protein aMBF1 (putative translation factor)
VLANFDYGLSRRRNRGQANVAEIRHSSPRDWDMITGEQVKAARALRALLGWDTTTLASKAGLADSVVREIEADSVVPYEARLLILRALRLSGVE